MPSRLCWTCFLPKTDTNRLAPKEESDADKPDAPGKPKRVTGANAKWRHEPLGKVDFSLQSYYRGKIYASNADGTYAPLHGAKSRNPRGRRPGKPNKMVYQVAVAGRLKPETIKPSNTWIGRPVVFGWALPVDPDARLDEMVNADRHLVERCLKKEEEDDRTGFGNARGISAVDGFDFEIA